MSTHFPTITTHLNGTPLGTIIDPGTVTKRDGWWFRSGTPGQLSRHKMAHALKVCVTHQEPGLIHLETPPMKLKEPPA